MPSVAAKLPIFQGNYRHGIDGSRRVMIPAKWRPKDPKIGFTVIAWPINEERFLLVLPPERWQAMLDKLKMHSLHNERIATLERVLGATSTQLVLDKVGRFCLPEGLAAAVGIEKEAEFVGRLDKFEIWNPSRFQAGVQRDKTVAAGMAEEIDL